MISHSMSSPAIGSKRNHIAGLRYASYNKSCSQAMWAMINHIARQCFKIHCGCSQFLLFDQYLVSKYLSQR